MGCKMTKAKKQRAKPSKRDEEASTCIDLGKVDIMTLDRKQLQKLCKELGLKANGKTTELQEKLKSYKPVDVNNNITEENEDHCEVFEDQKMKEQISQSDEHLDQIRDTAKARPRKTNKTTKAKKLGQQDGTVVGEIDEDGRKQRRKVRGKVKTEKKPQRNKTGKDLIKEDDVARSDEHLVDDESFVIEKICKYDEVSKYDVDDEDDDDAYLQRGRRNITRETVQQNADQGQKDKASSIDDTLIKNTKTIEKKNPEKSGENQADCLEDEMAEDSRRTKVKASRKYLREKKEKKVEKSRANSLLEEKELEGKTSKMKSKNEVNTDGQAQGLDESNNVQTCEDGDEKTRKDPAEKLLVKKGKNKQKDTKKTQVSLDKSLESAKPILADVNKECFDEEDYNSDEASEYLVVDVTGRTSDVNKECVNEEDYNSDEASEYLVVDVTGRTSDSGSCYDIEENKKLGTEISEARSQNEMSTTRDCSYYLKAVELEQSCLTEKEYESTFTVEENGHTQMDEKDESLPGYESDNSYLPGKESHSSLIVRENARKEVDSGEQERDSTFTVEEKDPLQTKETEFGSASLVERGSSVSSTEDGDLKTNESQRISKQSVTCCTRWCVVEGIAKHDSETSWKRIKLKGGRPIVPNRFGKYIAFVLEPSNIDVPCDFRDNYICGSCVRENERLNGERCGTTVALATRKQHLASRRSDSQNDDEDNETPLSTFTRGDGIRASVKRKRVEDRSTLKENQEELECQTKRQRNSLSSSNPGIPASPVVRKARGEKLKLPRNHKKAWRPKKSSRSSSPLKMTEDASFAQKVEAIIKTTVPGSEEELNMIMKKNCRVQRSPNKN